MSRVALRMSVVSTPCSLLSRAAQYGQESVVELVQEGEQGSPGPGHRSPTCPSFSGRSSDEGFIGSYTSPNGSSDGSSCSSSTGRGEAESQEEQ